MDRQRKEINDRIDDLDRDVNKMNQDMNKRFDETIRELAEQRERMARLEGSLDGFLAGRRDRDAA